jgi:hypothetical protein
VLVSKKPVKSPDASGSPATQIRFWSPIAVTSTFATTKLILQSLRNAMGAATGFAPLAWSIPTYAIPLRPWIRLIFEHILG